MLWVFLAVNVISIDKVEVQICLTVKIKIQILAMLGKPDH